jgi:hypothetical protein
MCPNKILLIVSIALLLLLFNSTSEGFISEKAQKIYDVTQKTYKGDLENVTFSNFKRKVPSVNFVEYDSIKKLIKGGNFSVDTVDKEVYV